MRTVVFGMAVMALAGGKEIVLDAGHGGSDSGAVAANGLKGKDLTLDVFGTLSSPPAANGTGTIASRPPHPFASGVSLESDTPAVIAETVFVTNDAESDWLENGRKLPDGTGVSRQQQIAEARGGGALRPGNGASPRRSYLRPTAGQRSVE